MLDILNRAILALAEHEALCTDRWKTALAAHHLAKATEESLRWEMQEAAGLHERLCEYIATLKPEGQQ